MGMLGALQHSIEQQRRKAYFLQNFANGEALYRSLRDQTPMSEAICKDGHVVLHPKGRHGFANMILEVWRDQVYSGAFFTPRAGDTIIDAGANIGLFALHIARLQPDCSVHCFEPFPDNFELLAKNVERYPAVQIYRIALADRRGYASMVDGGSRSQDHRMVEGDAASAVVETWTLGAALAATNRARIELFKCDIEGAESGVFRGCTDGDLQRVDRFAIEYHDNIQPGTSEYLTGRLSRFFELTVHADPNGYGMIYAKRADAI